MHINVPNVRFNDIPDCIPDPRWLLTLYMMIFSTIFNYLFQVHSECKQSNFAKTSL